MLDQIPAPLDRETPTAYADRVGQWYSSVQTGGSLPIKCCWE